MAPRKLAWDGKPDNSGRAKIVGEVSKVEDGAIYILYLCQSTGLAIAGRLAKWVF